MENYSVDLKAMGIVSIMETRSPRKVLKFNLDEPGAIQLPSEYRILTVNRFAGQNSVWIEVNPDRPLTIEATFDRIGTGWELDKKIYSEFYIGTIFHEPFVWHYYMGVK